MMSHASKVSESRDRVTCASLYCGNCLSMNTASASSQWNVPECVPISVC